MPLSSWPSSWGSYRVVMTREDSLQVPGLRMPSEALPGTPARWRDPLQTDSFPRHFTWLLPTRAGSQSSPSLGSRRAPHILFPGSPCLDSWAQGLNVHLTEPRRRCPSPQAVSFCELEFANEEGCHPSSMLKHIQCIYQGSFIPTSSI